MEFIAKGITKEYAIILPMLNEITRETHNGPLPESNKVFEGFYAGAFPGDIDNEINDENLITLLNEGFDTFVCLMSEYYSDADEDEWRYAFSHRVVRPYMNDIQRILENKEANTNLKNVLFKHYPIKDMSTIRDNETLQAAREVAELLKDGKKVYIHCWGGHGRTGVIVCLVLHLICGISAEEALIYCQYVHDKRENNCSETRSPQTMSQREQVKRIITSLKC